MPATPPESRGSTPQEAVTDDPSLRQPTDCGSVLIVDDERDLADLYEMWVADSYDTTVAYTGAEAMDLLNDCGCDIILLDRMLPDVSGDDILEYIGKTEPSCQVAMLTAVKPDIDIIEMACDSYLTKPVSRDELRSVVDRLCRMSQYPQTVQELCALVEKRSALRSQLPTDMIESNHEYGALEDRIAERHGQIQETHGEVPASEFPTLEVGLAWDKIETD